MEVHYCTGCAVLKRFLVVSLCNKCKEQTLNTERWLDNVRNVSLVCFLVEVVKLLAAGFDVLIEVLVCSVGNAPKLAPAEWEQVLKVGCCL